MAKTVYYTWNYLLRSYIIIEKTENLEFGSSKIKWHIIKLLSCKPLKVVVYPKYLVIVI